MPTHSIAILITEESRFACEKPCWIYREKSAQNNPNVFDILSILAQRFVLLTLFGNEGLCIIIYICSWKLIPWLPQIPYSTNVPLHFGIHIYVTQACLQNVSSGRETQTLLMFFSYFSAFLYTRPNFTQFQILQKTSRPWFTEHFFSCIYFFYLRISTICVYSGRILCLPGSPYHQPRKMLIILDSTHHKKSKS